MIDRIISLMVGAAILFFCAVTESMPCMQTPTQMQQACTATVQACCAGQGAAMAMACCCADQQPGSCEGLKLSSSQSTKAKGDAPRGVFSGPDLRITVVSASYGTVTKPVLSAGKLYLLNRSLLI
ncbi:MAG TPA: hypothetical protein V6C81_24605 [Planktothrix sp.]|jgi:hypothetical protein